MPRHAPALPSAPVCDRRCNVAGSTEPLSSELLRCFVLIRDHKKPISDRAKALAMIGSQIDAVMRKKETTSKRPTTDSPTGYLRPAKYAYMKKMLAGTIHAATSTSNRSIP